MRTSSFRSQLEALSRERLRVHERWISAIPPLLRGVFSAVDFVKTGFHDDLTDLMDLHHFAGGQHVVDLERSLLMTGPLVNESSLRAIQGAVDMFSTLERKWEIGICTLADRKNQPLLCWSSMLRSLISLRAVSQRASGGCAEILEIGPGSGYGSILMGFSGYRVKSIEVSRGYGVWQSILYSYMAQYIRSRKLTGVSAPSALDPADVYSVTPSKSLACDLIVANHMLNEMSRHSLFCLLQSLNTLSVKADIVVEGWGLGSRLDLVKNAQTENIMNYFGYELRYHRSTSRISKRSRRQVAEHNGKVCIPVSVFVKRKNKNIKNVKLRGAVYSNRKTRDLEKSVGSQRELGGSMNISRNEFGTRELRGLYERAVLRDRTTRKPIDRAETVLLDYIGLNSNNSVPYLRGNSGRRF